MKTLNSPIFEVNQESDYYQKKKARKEKQARVNDILDEVANVLGVDVNEFSYYRSSRFGFGKLTNAFDKYEQQLTKNADRNGIHTFKLKTEEFKIVSPMLKEVDEINKENNPFDLHDIFGINNPVASHWIDDRLFFEVKDAAVTEKLIISEKRSKRYPIEPVKQMNYKEYLLLSSQSLDEI